MSKGVYTIIVLIFVVFQLFAQDSIPLNDSPKDSMRSRVHSSPYNISIGSNFDFIKGVDFKDLFFEISTFSPDLMTIQGVQFGIHSGVSKSYARSYDLNFSTVEIVGKHVEEGSNYIGDFKKMKKTSNLSLKNTVFYLNPILNLYSKTQEANSFSLLLSLDIEMMKQEVLWEYSYEELKVESQPISKARYERIKSDELLDREAYDRYIYAIGIGIPFMIQHNSSSYGGKLKAGYCKNIRNHYWDLNQVYLGFMIEVFERDMGVKIRTELRMIGFEDPPYIGFNIAKNFGFRKVLNHIQYML